MGPQSWGIVAGGAILQNVLEDKLPAPFLATLPHGQEFAYTLIPAIPGLDEPLRSDVRVAFADGARLIWKVMIGVSAAGLLTCLLMREVDMMTAATAGEDGEGDGE